MSKRKKYQIAAWIMVVALVLLIIVAGGYFTLNGLGKMRLRQNASSQMPSLSNKLNADGSAEEIPEPDDAWEEDWIRYNGQVYDYNENIMTFLCMGIDVDEELSDKQSGQNAGQADAIFLLVLNPDKKKISIMAIDRNTMTEINILDKDGAFEGTYTGQLALAHGYGDGKEESAENVLSAVSRIMYDLPIHGYCAVNMAAIPVINDVVGGVEVTVLEDMTNVNKVFKKGERVLLKEWQAYWYVRFRDINVEESARNRLNRQKQYLTAYIAKAREVFKSDMTLPITLFNGISKYMTTDLTLDEVVYLAGNAAGYTFSEHDLIMIPGETDTSGRYDEFYPDEEALKQIIVEVFYTPVDNME